MSEKLTEFDCPVCHVKIPAEYMAKNTKFIHLPKRPNTLVCIGCGETYEELVKIAMEKRIAENFSMYTGIKPETILAIRKEQEQIRAEDEKLVDDEVDVMDGKKARKIFKKKGDQHEESKSPLEVIFEQFRKGLEKVRQRKIIIPVRGLKLKGGSA